ncbi:hypothetical protein BV372_08170 [Nostoc sp. T09]|uniref:hypothetical protein n=1 Tax=Nostoc sp. T09 TaxID=1932621 RepID=UPI000A3BB4B0|nr:hypothetical protein [Nostoc sp. T09]OUL36381.1 hypothetical protein BV372_08170 [Nostoc sp. T09]
MTVKVRQLIEILQDFPPDAEIFIKDVDDGQEFSIFGIEPGIREAIVNFEIQKREDERDNLLE